MAFQTKNVDIKALHFYFCKEPRIIYYWGSIGWVLETSEVVCVSRFILKIIHFSTFWHTFTSIFSVFYFIVLCLLLFFHFAQYPQGFAYLIFPSQCSFWWFFFLLPTSFAVYTSDWLLVHLLYIFIISQFIWWFNYCLSTRKIFSFNIGKLAVGQGRIEIAAVVRIWSQWWQFKKKKIFLLR